jgi:hypothetical protein
MAIIVFHDGAQGASASVCDDPQLLPVDHEELARCATMVSANVSGAAAFTPVSADICVVRGREYASGGNGSHDRFFGPRNLYYIGGSIGYEDEQTGDIFTVENFGQYWWTFFEFISWSFVCNGPQRLVFSQRVICGLGSPDHYRTTGWLDRETGRLRYLHKNCSGQLELDFELQCR